MELSEKLKKYRQAIHLTQSEVASKLNVSRKTISGWENNHSTPDLNSLVKLSDIYHVSFDVFISDQNSSQPHTPQLEHNNRNIKIYRRSNILNYFFVPLLYIELFRPYGFHSVLIPIFAIINSVVFMAYYPNFPIFKNRIFLLKVLFTFIFMFTINVFANLIDESFLNFLHSSQMGFLFGFALGRIILIFLVTFCSLFLFLNKSSKESR